MTAHDLFALANWRRTISELYAAVRAAPPEKRKLAAERFRSARDDLFKFHPQSPLTSKRRAHFECLSYFPYDPAMRVIGRIRPISAQKTMKLELPAEGLFRFTPFAQVEFTLDETESRLTLYWIEGYGGGLFLPFQDQTSGVETYGGGRYLYDTIKGADLGAEHDSFLLDFNYAYNPSCAYNDRWVCPLSPPENRLAVAISAGEMAFNKT